MKSLLQLLRVAPGSVAVTFFTGVASGASSIALIALLSASLGRGREAGALAIGGFAGLSAVMLISGVGAQILTIRLAHGAIADLRKQLGRRILAAPLHDLEAIGAHRLLPILTDDVGALTDALLAVPLLFINATTVIACLAYLTWLSPLVLLTVLGFLIVGVASFQLIAGPGLRYLKEARASEDTLFKHLRALIEGIKELKLHAARRRAFLAESLDPSAEELRRRHIVGLSLYCAANGWGQILFFVYVGLLLFASPAELAADSPVLVGTVLAVMYIKTPLDVIMALIPRFSRARVAFEALDRLGLSLGGDDPVEAPGAVAPAGEGVEFEGVTHTYPGDRERSGFSLGPISLRVRPGEVVFLVGGNGSGKTTLAKLITGLYAPDAGRLRLHGREITADLREWYRQHVSAVFSDYHLFERLIGLDRRGLDEEARRYLRELGLDHKVQIQAGTLSTIALSQGQRKRLALLTAYLEDRPLYVFDEWASDQEPTFREIFYMQILPALRDRKKMVIVITHDDRYFHLADRVLKLDYGRIEAPADLGANR